METKSTITHLYSQVLMGKERATHLEKERKYVREKVNHRTDSRWR